MRKIKLAVLPAGAPLVDAFSAMRVRKQSAIVTLKQAGHAVITAQQIIRGIRAGKTSIDDLAAPAPAPGKEIQLIRIRGGVASIIVGDRLATTYSAFPAGCRCVAGDHYWDPWEAPEFCTYDQTKVVCGRRK
jgi:hypothetical protein